MNADELASVLSDCVGDEILPGGGYVAVMSGIPENDIVDVIGSIDEVGGKLDSVFQVVVSKVSNESEEEVVTGSAVHI
mgnify:FL=1